MRAHSIYGLLTPYGVRTDNFCGFGDGIYGVLQRGALTAEALEATGTEFRINHERPHIEGARVRLVNARSGLYVLAYLPDSERVSEIMAGRSRWTGLSIGFLDKDSSVFRDVDRDTQHVTAVTRVLEASLLIDQKPAFGTTWVTADIGEYSRRYLADEKAWCDARGIQIKDSLAPRQCPSIEAKLQARDPNRAAELWVQQINYGVSGW